MRSGGAEVERAFVPEFEGPSNTVSETELAGVIRALCFERNRPCIIRGCEGSFTDDAKLLRTSLSPEGLLSTFSADHHVPVCSGTPSAASAPSHSENHTTLSHALSGDSEQLYLKDWHYVLERAAAADSRAANELSTAHPPLPYRLPQFLGREDFLNSFCDATRLARARVQNCEEAPQYFGSGDSDYRFVYIGHGSDLAAGGGGTWTPLHYDVFGSYSWSFNVQGYKAWYFLETWQEGPSANEADAKACPAPGLQVFTLGPWPLSGERPVDCRVLGAPPEGWGWRLHCVVQRPGDLVFVPAMVYHQVHNFADEQSESRLTISINHNWITRFNLERCCWLVAQEAAALARMVDVEARAAFMAEGAWHALRERMLHSAGGWNVGVMQQLLLHVAAEGSSNSGAGGYDDPDETGVWQLSRVLARASKILEDSDH